MTRWIAALACASACAASTAPVSVTEVTSTSTSMTAVVTTTTAAPSPAVVASAPAAPDLPAFDLSGGPTGTDFGAVVREYSQLIRWIYLHPDRLGEVAGHFMPEGPAFLYLEQVTAEFVSRGWRVDLGLWELLEEPTLVAGGDPEGVVAGVFVSYTKRAPSPILSVSSAETVDVLPPFARQTFQMALRYVDGSWKVFRDDNTVVR